MITHKRIGLKVGGDAGSWGGFTGGLDGVDGGGGGDELVFLVFRRVGGSGTSGKL